MLSRQLEVSLRLAVSMARQKRHEFLTVEHLLLALLDNDSAVNALKACGADIIVLRKELEEYVEQHTPKLAENSDQAPHPTESFDIHRFSFSNFYKDFFSTWNCNISDCLSPLRQAKWVCQKAHFHRKVQFRQWNPYQSEDIA